LPIFDHRASSEKCEAVFGQKTRQKQQLRAWERFKNRDQCSRPTILILGGSEIAYQLAQEMQSLPVNIISSLAGRTQNPRLPVGAWRIGGFGGIDGLVRFLHDNHIRLVVDATHPFARKMQANARIAAERGGIDLLRLQRPPWQPQPGDRWIPVQDENEAAALLPKGSSVFLALGRQHLQAFIPRRDVQFVARMLEKTDDIRNLRHFTLILDRPATRDEEIRLLRTHKITMLVCRNSGACASYGKIAAARELQLPIAMITAASLTDETPTLTTVQATIRYILKQLSEWQF